MKYLRGRRLPKWSKTEVGRRNRDFRFTLESRHQADIASCPKGGGSTYGADQGTRCTAWTVAGEDDHTALSNERYVGGDGQPG